MAHHAVAGVFDNPIGAHHALTQLLDAGIDQDRISLLVSSQTRERIFTDKTTVSKGAQDAMKGAIGGGLSGGFLGALIGSLTVVGNLMVPGAGLLAAGPIVAAFSGAGLGAAMGGLSGALVAAGFSEDDAGKFEKELHDGKAVIVVHPNKDKEETEARQILSAYGAITKAA